MKKIDKPWGWEEIIEHNEQYILKKLFMKKGEECSFQYHKKKLETFYVLSGILTLKWEENRIKFQKSFVVGESMTIYPGTKHKMKAIVEDCYYLECSTPHLDDVVRIKDKYGRT